MCDILLTSQVCFIRLIPSEDVAIATQQKIAYEHMHATQCVCAHTDNIRQAYRQQVWISETELRIHEIRNEMRSG